MRDFMLGVLLGGSLGTFLFKSKKGKKMQTELLKKYNKMSHAAHAFIKEKTSRGAPRKAARSSKKR